MGKGTETRSPFRISNVSLDLGLVPLDMVINMSATITVSMLLLLHKRFAVIAIPNSTLPIYFFAWALATMLQRLSQ